MSVAVYILIALIVLAVVCRDFLVNVLVEGDASKKLLRLYVFVLGFKFFSAYVHLDIGGGGIILEHRGKKTEIHLSADTKDRKSLAAIMSNPLFSYFILKELKTEFALGLKHDPLLTTIAFAAARIALYSFMGIIKTKYPLLKAKESFTPSFLSDTLYLTIFITGRISIAGIICGIFILVVEKIKGVINIKKRLKNRLGVKKS